MRRGARELLGREHRKEALVAGLLERGENSLRCGGHRGTCLSCRRPRPGRRREARRSEGPTARLLSVNAAAKLSIPISMVLPLCRDDALDDAPPGWRGPRTISS